MSVISQTLLKKVSGGRIAAWEIMVANSAIRNLIRESKVPQMYSVIQTSQAEGMHTLDQHLLDLVRNRIVSVEEARARAVDKTKFSVAPNAAKMVGRR